VPPKVVYPCVAVVTRSSFPASMLFIDDWARTGAISGYNPMKAVETIASRVKYPKRGSGLAVIIP